MDPSLSQNDEARINIETKSTLDTVAFVDNDSSKRGEGFSTNQILQIPNTDTLIKITEVTPAHTNNSEMKSASVYKAVTTDGVTTKKFGATAKNNFGVAFTQKGVTANTPTPTTASETTTTPSETQVGSAAITSHTATEIQAGLAAEKEYAQASQTIAGVAAQTVTATGDAGELEDTRSGTAGAVAEFYNSEVSADHTVLTFSTDMETYNISAGDEVVQKVHTITFAEQQNLNIAAGDEVTQDSGGIKFYALQAYNGSFTTIKVLGMDTIDTESSISISGIEIDIDSVSATKSKAKLTHAVSSNDDISNVILHEYDPLSLDVNFAGSGYAVDNTVTFTSNGTTLTANVLSVNKAVGFQAISLANWVDGGFVDVPVGQTLNVYDENGGNDVIFSVNVTSVQQYLIVSPTGSFGTGETLTDNAGNSYTVEYAGNQYALSGSTLNTSMSTLTGGGVTENVNVA